MLSRRWLSLVLGGFMIFSGASVRADDTVVHVKPPRDIEERQEPSPGPAYVWIPGHYRWVKTSFEWVPGHWEVPPHEHAVWVPYKWVKQNGGWVLKDGRWK